MEKEYILFIDSGVGGLSTLAEIYQRLDENYIYFADNKNHPYGNKSPEKLCEILTKIITDVKCHYKLKMVVLACNTATTSVIDSLREKFPETAFIGTEPAIKLAENLGYKRILVLVTKLTSCQPKFKNLVENTKKIGTIVKVLVVDKFASNIERNLIENSFLSNFRVLKNLYTIKLNSKNIDSVVLGCTHYCHEKKRIENLTGKTVLDGNFGVFKRVLTLDKQFALSKSFPVFMLSNSSKFTKQKYVKIFNQILANK
ncbi:MAG: glutamate racemase [Clostridia bacterium]|nr:glutamate racemase [Clostridia bacterium]